jgi:hypothetical protein
VFHLIVLPRCPSANCFQSELLSRLPLTTERRRHWWKENPDRRVISDVFWEKQLLLKTMGPIEGT